MSGRRAERVSRQVVQALAEIAESEVHDPRLQGITFTSAQATDDLHTVRVYFSILGDGSMSTAAEDGLKAASGFLRRELAHRLSLRYVPSLVFEYDQSILTAERIDRLLREGKHEGDSGGPRNADDDVHTQEDDGDEDVSDDAFDAEEDDENSEEDIEDEEADDDSEGKR